MSLRTPSLRSVPHYVSPLSGHAILCSQGKWGRGAVPLTYVSLGSVPSLGGGLEAKNILFFTALMLAAFNNYPAVVLRLLRAGADAKLRSVSGDTALGFAKKQGHSE